MLVCPSLSKLHVLSKVADLLMAMKIVEVTEIRLTGDAH